MIVNATAESRALYAFDKLTGKEIWQSKADGYAETWGTPVLVGVNADGTDLVIGEPDEIWGLNPDDGDIRWYCSKLKGNSFCSVSWRMDPLLMQWVTRAADPLL